MPENHFPGPEATPPAPEDAPCRHELRITLLNGGVDEIGAEAPSELRGYLRALLNHGLISPAEHGRQRDVLQSYLHAQAALVPNDRRS